MRPREYVILRECVDNGVQRGWIKAHKHSDNPTPGQIQGAIEAAVMDEINEYFLFDELGD